MGEEGQASRTRPLNRGHTVLAVQNPMSMLSALYPKKSLGNGSRLPKKANLDANSAYWALQGPQESLTGLLAEPIPLSQGSFGV